MISDNLFMKNLFENSLRLVGTHQHVDDYSTMRIKINLKYSFFVPKVTYGKN